MTAVKKGDRVRVTVEDDVNHIFGNGSFETSEGRYFHSAGGDHYTVEVLAPVLHVDDVVTLEDLAAATDKTVVVDKDGDAWQYRDEEWLLLGDDYAKITAQFAPFVVVYAPKVKP